MPRSRYVGRDATDSVVRHGLLTARGDSYHRLVATTWPRFLGALVGGYFAVNAIFACAYLAVPGAVANARAGSFTDAFFFSVQTLATIGYGTMYPQTFYANLLMAIESTVGILGLALVTGLAFTKFARPTARVLFTHHAIVSTRDGAPSLLFRMANARRTQIVEAHAHVILARQERTREGEAVRRLYDLALVRAETPVFALTWTAIHPITPASPLHGATPESLAADDVEIVVSLVGIDETLSQTVHARWSYLPEDIRWGGRFADVLSFLPDGRRRVDYTRFDDVEFDSGE
jgi:inward rectifier potassium channel